MLQNQHLDKPIRRPAELDNKGAERAQGDFSEAYACRCIFMCAPLSKTFVTGADDNPKKNRHRANDA